MPVSKGSPRREPCAILFLVGAILFLAVTIYAETYTTDELTLVEEAMNIFNRIDQTIEPCDDFYSFACGQIIKDSVLQVSDRFGITVYIQHNAMREKMDILRGLRDSDVSDSQIVRILKTFQTSCLDASHRANSSMTSVQRIIGQLGGWPVVLGEEWDRASFDWETITHKLRATGLDLDVLMLFLVKVDVVNTSHFDLYFGMLDTDISKKVLIDMENEKENYLEGMVHIAELFGAETARAITEMTAVFEFQWQLLNIARTTIKQYRYPFDFPRMSISEMDSAFPGMSWQKYVDSVMQTGVNINPNHVVFIEDITYMERLMTLLSNTDKRTQANYVFWATITSLYEDQMAPFLKPNDKATLGVFQIVPNYDVGPDTVFNGCFKIVENYLSPLITSMYIKRFPNEEIRRELKEWAKTIQRSVEDMFTKSTWLSVTVKAKLVEKAKAMTFTFGYSDDMTDEKLAEIYSDLILYEDQYLENLLKIRKLHTDFMLSTSILDPSVQWFSKLKMNYNSHSPFYWSNLNEVIFPHEFLNRLWFNSKRPQYLNYGAIGFVIGHEIIHGFTTHSLWHFDWDERSSYAFQSHVDCIVELNTPDFNSSAESLFKYLNDDLIEDISDISGIRAAYLAYTAWSDQQLSPEPPLLGLEWLSSKQMFWVFATQQWCSKPVLGAFSRRLTGALSNSEEFAKDFQCPLGTKMNPVKKCTVW